MASMCLFARCAAKFEECWKRPCAKKAFGGINRLGREKMRRAGKESATIIARGKTRCLCIKADLTGTTLFGIAVS